MNSRGANFDIIFESLASTAAEAEVATYADAATGIDLDPEDNGSKKRHTGAEDDKLVSHSFHPAQNFDSFSSAQFTFKAHTLGF
jgi:hypothetical protein